MSKSAAFEVAKARKRYGGGGIYGETLAATLGTDASKLKHTCFHEHAANILSPPLRPDETTPKYMMEALAR